MTSRSDNTADSQQFADLAAATNNYLRTFGLKQTILALTSLIDTSMAWDAWDDLHPDTLPDWDGKSKPF